MYQISRINSQNCNEKEFTQETKINLDKQLNKSLRSNYSNDSNFNQIIFNNPCKGKNMINNFKQIQIFPKNQNISFEYQYQKQIKPSNLFTYHQSRKRSLDSQSSNSSKHKQKVSTPIKKQKKQRKSKTINNIEIIQLNSQSNHKNKPFQDKYNLKIKNLTQQSQFNNQALYEYLALSKLDIHIDIPEKLNNNNNNTNHRRNKTQQLNKTISRFNQYTVQKPKQNFSRVINKYVKKRTRQSFSKTFSQMMNKDHKNQQHQYDNQINNNKNKNAKNTERDRNLKRLYNKNMQNILIGDNKQKIEDYIDKRQKLKKIFNYKYMNSFLNDYKMQNEKIKTKSYYSFLQKQPIFRNQLLNKIGQMKVPSQQKLSKNSSRLKVKRIRTPASLSLKKKYQSNLVDKQKSLDIHTIYSKSNPFIMIDHITPFSKQKMMKNTFNCINNFKSNKKRNLNNSQNVEKQLEKATNFLYKDKHYNKSKKSKTQWRLSAWDGHQNAFHYQEKHQFQF